MVENEYSIQEASELLGVPIPKLRRWDKQGVLVALRTEGGHRRYPRDLIDQIANSGGSGDKIVAGTRDRQAFAGRESGASSSCWWKARAATAIWWKPRTT